MAGNGQRPPLVILGFDAGDPDIVEEEVRAGNLPTIASVMRRGRWCRLADPEQVLPYGTWVSLFSGFPHSRHGYFYFRQLQPGTYDLRATRPRDAVAVPFWSRAHDRRVAIIDAPEIQRPIGGVAGIQLANWCTNQLGNHPMPAASEPAGLLDDARRVFGPQLPVTDFALHASGHEQTQMFRRLMDRVERKGTLCRHLLSQGRFDLIVAGFFEAHIGSHRFWDDRPEMQGVSPGNPELSQAVRELYRAIDREMGRVLEGLPRDANVFIVSVYGMDTQYPTTGLMEAFCRELGYQAPAPPPAPSLRPLALARRLIPETWRFELSNWLPEPMQERLLADNFRGATNWQKTTAFAVPSLYAGFLTVNLRGREPEGIVEPGAAYEETLERLEGDLAQLVDPSTGTSPLRKVVRAGELLQCDQRLPLPDLLVSWKSHTQLISRLLHPRAELHQAKPHFFRSSYHSDRGFLAAIGPCIERWDGKGDFALADLAPTFLALLGVPVPDDLPGEVVPALLSA